MKTPWLIFLNICMLFSVCLSLYAAFTSYFHSNNQRDETLAQIKDRLQAIEEKLPQVPPANALRELPESLAPNLAQQQAGSKVSKTEQNTLSDTNTQQSPELEQNFAANIPVPPPPPRASTSTQPENTQANSEASISPSTQNPPVISDAALDELIEVPAPPPPPNTGTEAPSAPAPPSLQPNSAQ